MTKRWRVWQSRTTGKWWAMRDRSFGTPTMAHNTWFEAMQHTVMGGMTLYNWKLRRR